MQRLPNEIETRKAVRRMNAAFRRERVVELAYFRELKEWRTTSKGERVQRPVYFSERSWVLRAFGRRPMLESMPERIRVEPVGEVQWSAKGHPWVDVIRWPKAGEGEPQARRLRLDRVAVGVRGLRLRVTRDAFLVRGSDMDPT